MDTQSSQNILLGCTACIVSSAFQSIGLILQRKSHIYSTSKLNANSTYNKSLWHIGLLIFLLSNLIGSSIQITSLPLILLSPLQSIGLVFNTLFHTILLNEPFTNSSLYGTLLITFGAFFIAYCGNSLSEPVYTLPEFIILLKNHNFVVWILLLSLLISLLSLIIYLINNQISKKLISNFIDKLDNDNNTRFPFLISFLSFIFVNDLSTLIKLKGLLFGLISGILSAFSLLLAKSSIEIILNVFLNNNWKSLNDISTYLIVVIFLSLGISQLFLLNKGLKNISTSILYPLVFCIFNLISISNSLIFFKQWSQLSNTMFGFLILGIFLIIIGVFMLSLQDYKNDTINLDNASLINHYPKSKTSIKTNSSPCSNFYDLEESLANNLELSDNESVIIHSNTTNNNFNNNSIGTIIQNNSFSNNDLITPFIKKTQENFNNASKKVTGFLKSSNDQLFANNSNIDNNNNNNYLSNTIDGNILPSYLTNQTNNNGNNTPIINENTPLNNSKLNEYVSFDSLRDMNRSTSPSVKSDYESLSQHFNYFDHEPSNGLNILQPIIGKIKKQASLLELPNDYSINNSNNNNNKISSSHKSSLSFSFKNLTQSFDDETTHNNNNNNGNERLKNKNSSSMRDQFDDDYNPNNTFNYSFSNTLEEIQNQLHALDSSAIDYNNTNDIPSPHLKNDTSFNSLNDISSLNKTNTYNSLNTANNSNHLELNKLLPRSLSLKHYYSQKFKKPDNSNTGNTGNANVRNTPNKHRRVYSYEQNLLLNELKKK